jgi:hypothetical protein
VILVPTLVVILVVTSAAEARTVTDMELNRKGARATTVTLATAQAVILAKTETTVK